MTSLASRRSFWKAVFEGFYIKGLRDYQKAVYRCQDVIEKLKRLGFEIIRKDGISPSFARFLSKPARALGLSFFFHSFALLVQIKGET